jgi:hypothetical protein
MARSLLKNNRIGSLTIWIIILVIYKSWLLPGTLSSGDWPYLSLEDIQNFSWIPESRFLWLAPYYQWTAKFGVQVLGMSWELTERIFWFIPFLGISIYSSYYLTRSWIGVLIYVTNSYILMVVGGGQLGVAMAYALAPLVLAKFIQLLKKAKSTPHNTNHPLLITSFIFALQMMFDPRIALITLFAVIIYGLFRWHTSKLSIRHIAHYTLHITLIALLLNLYWLLPMLQGKGVTLDSLGSAFNTPGIVKFLSFAFFENTISLLHPNWPLNEFGKVKFQQPEFLILPIFAFASLLFIKIPKLQITNYKLQVLYFSILALVGSFLAKGANDPFGGIYLWLAEYIPGFIMYRDPTKWYLLIAISYSVLIPYTLKHLRLLIKSKLSARGGPAFGWQITNYQLLITLFFVLLWTFTIREAILGKLTGTFQP